MQDYGVGTLAIFDGVDGRAVPCKVTAITRAMDTGMIYITARATAARPAVAKGETLHFHARYFIPKAHIRQRRYHRVAVGTWTWNVSDRRFGAEVAQ